MREVIKDDFIMLLNKIQSEKMSLLTKIQSQSEGGC